MNLNKLLEENEYIIRVAIYLIVLTVFVVGVTFSVSNTLERNRQHDNNMTEIKQEQKKQQDLRIKQEILYDEMLDHYKQIKENNK